MNDDFNIDSEDDEPTAPFWMTTFSDMVTLLLTFFVMIVAMSEVEVKKFKEALSYFQGDVDVLESTDAITTIQRRDLMEALETREQAESYEELMTYLSVQDLEDKVQVNLTEDGLHIVITDSLMFDSGEAELIEPSRTVLRLIGGMLDAKVQAVKVEGHTDDRPIHTERFPSNWELSAARAASVVRFLLAQGHALEPSRYVAIGYGEHRPIDTRGSPAARARNRRVEILFSWKPWPHESKTPPAQIQPTML